MKVSGQSTHPAGAGPRRRRRPAAPPRPEGLAWRTAGRPLRGSIPPSRLPRRPAGGRPAALTSRGATGGRAQPSRQPAQRVVGGGPQPAPVVVVQELRLVRGHVDAHRAVAAAALAGQAQVERVVDLGRAPAVVISSPASISCSSRARPRVESCSSPVARKDGHITAAGAGAVGAALGRRRRSGGRPRRSRRRRAGSRTRAGAGARPGARRSGGCRRAARGSDEDAGVEPAVRVPEVLDLGESRDRVRRVHPRQQLGRGPAVAVLAGQRAAVARRRGRPRPRGSAEAPARRAGQQVEVDADVDAAVAEVPVRDAAQAVVGQQGAEVAQVGAEPGGRHGRVLPAGPGLAAGRARVAVPGAVLADPPQRGRLGRVGDDPAVQRVAAGRGDQPAARPPRLGRGRAGRPRRTARRRPSGSPARPGPRRRTTSTMRASMPSTASGPCGSSVRDGLGRRGHVGVAEHDERAARPAPGPAGRSPPVTTPSVPSLPTRARARSARARAAGASSA